MNNTYYFQGFYFGLLKELGFDPLVHDIRFVEDNWESPTLGAWGLGWEVWLNGMEVTQFTIFNLVLYHLTGATDLLTSPECRLRLQTKTNYAPSYPFYY